MLMDGTNEQVNSFTEQALGEALRRGDCPPVVAVSAAGSMATVYAAALYVVSRPDDLLTRDAKILQLMVLKDFAVEVIESDLLYNAIDALIERPV